MSGEIQIVNGPGVDLRCCAYELRSARDLSIASFDVEVSCSSADPIELFVSCVWPWSLKAGTKT